MSDALQLPAELRERAGKGASRELRRNGRVPAVIYGGKEEPTPIHVEEKLLLLRLNTGHFMNSIIEIELDGKTVRTLPKDVALHPVTDRPLHADFLRLSADSKVHVEVPVVFINEDKSPGLKRGAVLNVVRHELELVCDPELIPSEIKVDCAGFNVGEAIHISNVTLPAGSVSAITDRDFTIATIVAPSGMKSSDNEAAEG